MEENGIKVNLRTIRLFHNDFESGKISKIKDGGKKKINRKGKK